MYFWRLTPAEVGAMTVEQHNACVDFMEEVRKGQEAPVQRGTGADLMRMAALG